MINDNTAIFSTDDNDSDKEMWAGADGIIKFENNSIKKFPHFLWHQLMKQLKLLIMLLLLVNIRFW